MKTMFTRIMNAKILSRLLLLPLAIPVTGSAQQFLEEDLAATISWESGYPEEGYQEYARSLARTLNMLSATQSTRVLKGKRPFKKAEVAAAKAARDAALEAAKKGANGGNGNGKGNAFGSVKNPG